MINIKLNYNFGYTWNRYNATWAKGYLFYNGKLYYSKQLAKFFEDISNYITLKKILKEVYGIFSVISQKDEEIWLIQDITRTFPIFYTIINDEPYVTDDTFYLKNAIVTEFSKDALIEFLRVLYVLNNRTLLSNVNQVQAGEIVRIRNTKILREFYHTHIVKRNEIFAADVSDLKTRAMNSFESTINRLIEFAKGDTIVIPLSGGYDSRLIATLLKLYNYDNVVLYTYGDPESEEVKTAKKVAEKLGYEWHHILLEDPDEYMNSDEFLDFIKYSFNHVSTPHLPDFYAFKLAIDNGIIPKNAIVVPGHSGDVFGGSWLKKLPLPTPKNFCYVLFAKHFIINEHYDKNCYLRQKLKLYFDRNYSNEVEVYSLDDNWNFKERQAKFIINSNRAYEFFGYKHAIPLWDLELVEFFKRVPLELKVKRSLYTEVAMEYFKKVGVDFRKSSSPFGSSEFLKRVKYFVEVYFPYWIKRPLKDFKWSDQINFRALVYPLSLDLGRKYSLSDANGIIAEWVLKKFGYLPYGGC